MARVVARRGVRPVLTPRPGHAHGDGRADPDADFYDSFVAVPEKGAHRWVVSDGPDAADATRGYAARCEACGLHVVAMVRLVGRALSAEILVAGYRIGGAIHVVTPAAREPYAPKKHGRCASTAPASASPR